MHFAEFLVFMFFFVVFFFGDYFHSYYLLHNISCKKNSVDPHQTPRSVLIEHVPKTGLRS